MEIETKKLKHQLTINEYDEKNIEKRKNLIFQRTESIQQLEKLYTLNLNQKPKRKIVINKSPMVKIQSSKNLIYNPFSNNKKNSIEKYQRKYFSKESLNPIKIDNNNSNQNNSSNQNKLNFNSIKDFSRGVMKKNTNIKLSTKHLNPWKKEFKNHKSINIVLNSQNILNSIKQLKNKKKINPLEIQEEDKIFNELNNSKNLNEEKNKTIINENKKSRNLSSDLQKTKSMFYYNKLCLNDNDKILYDVYKLPSDYFEKVDKVKKSKDKFDLKTYQTNLLNTISDYFSRDGVKNLEKNFIHLRNYSYQKIVLNKPFIKDIEKKEKKIIKRINNVNQKCKDILLKTAEDFRKLRKLTLPKVKFHNVIKRKKIHFFQTELSDDSFY
jgi:hypothetical protein